MGRHFALTFQLPAYQTSRNSGRSQSRTNSKSNYFAISNQNLGFAIFTLCALLVIIYLVQVNSFSTKGFEIRNLQNQISQLKDQQRQLQVQSAELQSFQRIQNDPALLNMVPVTNISYVQASTVSER